MPEHLLLDFSWGFLWKAIVLGVFAYFIWPIIFVARSWLVKCFISKLINWTKTDSKLNDIYLKHQISIKLDSFLHAETSAELRSNILIEKSNLGAEIESLKTDISNFKNIIDWTKQHFKLDNYDSGFEKWITKCEARKIGHYSTNGDLDYEKLANGTLSLSDYLLSLKQEFENKLVKYHAP